ncbi:hypothetical protein QBC46DRAFT_117307 [Diplogelasinospora grovesii]|uniref:Uncharacterized protein n=1 Tax=Diplogelasinospora grovesii TaxID=303347 RepID=A0AAN6S9X1_9PEZI|nr:hypothetical protein QBC46DRAFT_117307 [Diplogelasinospora grovesii]
MHPAPNLAEAPPKNDEPRPGQHQPASPETHVTTNGTHHHDNRGRPGEPTSPPVRKDTTSSTATNATLTSLASFASNETVGSVYSVETSPNFPTQAVFSVKDGTDVNAQRRASRRRTGPLSTVQRERAAIIRKVGACTDCRRRRVACHPNHHGMTWEQAAKKFRSHSPTMQELSPLSGRPLSPAPLNSKPVFTQDPQEMDVDISPTHQHHQHHHQHQPGRAPMNEARISRTPLPSGPRPDKPPGMPPLPGFDSFRPDLQGVANRILTNPCRSRYESVHALFLHWQDDDDQGVRTALGELANVLNNYYNYTFEIKPIPSSSNGCKNPWKWVSQELNDFLEKQDRRDCLKIIYYSGFSYLDGNREMVLARSHHAELASTIRWSYVQQILENSQSDIMVIMDCAYYPSSKPLRKEGVLELIAAAASESHTKFLNRSAFTRALTDQLRTRASQKFKQPLTVAGLHAKLLSAYPEMLKDISPEKEIVTSFPSPLYLHFSTNKYLPSIFLAPLSLGILPPVSDSPSNGSGGSQMSLTFRLSDDTINQDAWAEWFRSMPEGIREVKVEGPYRNNTFR